MGFLLFGAVCYLGYKLFKVSTTNKYYAARYMNDVPPQQLMYTPNGQAHPVWCPNCGRNL